MKKFAILFSVVSLTFAFAVSTVNAQNAPAKKSTEKVVSAKTDAAAAPAVEKKDAKGCCTSAKSTEAKAGCATPCSSEKAKACCSGDKAKAAKPVPAPQSK
ncbi:hypothetical protein TBC1_11666 [Lentimicrobium saccharophilum]|uniref:Uncharacterized protein n=1 Tax=Lentimicrobium saccharophilum TaxID=1678841 RepID=A0A0S7BVX3_9BACT|nr:hypothetical protein [Lentimicrobium saccharophilum]GAP42535.1 hypothetical protein TBC1_11666 [Lentimicrobium saccharophilum]